ncbi:hypothetical protein HZA98_04660 [Candidatus Woesearchaeota archaeon]|nr:hypothetical protein [Candidatus Woesearchaeota archaeon]
MVSYTSVVARVLDPRKGSARLNVRFSHGKRGLPLVEEAFLADRAAKLEEHRKTGSLEEVVLCPEGETLHHCVAGMLPLVTLGGEREILLVPKLDYTSFTENFHALKGRDGYFYSAFGRALQQLGVVSSIQSDVRHALVHERQVLSLGREYVSDPASWSLFPSYASLPQSSSFVHPLLDKNPSLAHVQLHDGNQIDSFLANFAVLPKERALAFGLPVALHFSGTKTLHFFDLVGQEEIYGVRVHSQKGEEGLVTIYHPSGSTDSISLEGISFKFSSFFRALYEGIPVHSEMNGREKLQSFLEHNP